MKPDKLEKFISENRDEFDFLEPGEEVWNRIQRPEQKVRRLSWQSVAWRVAAGIVIFISAYFFHDFIDRRQSNNIALTEQKPVAQPNENVQVLVEADAYYTSQINTAKLEIEQRSSNDPTLLKEINVDLVELDKVFAELKNDLKDNSDNEEVIEAMIQNYRLKLQILEDVLNQLKKSQNDKGSQNKKHEI